MLSKYGPRGAKPRALPAEQPRGDDVRRDEIHAAPHVGHLIELVLQRLGRPGCRGGVMNQRGSEVSAFAGDRSGSHSAGGTAPGTSTIRPL